MNEIQLTINDSGEGSFSVEREGERLAEMVIRISGKNLTVYHTQVSEKLQGQGIASKLLETMVDYVRKHELKVIPLCSFVRAKFEKHKEQYADIWNQNWHN